jgi:hypothetical protein
VRLQRFADILAAKLFEAVLTERRDWQVRVGFVKPVLELDDILKAAVEVERPTILTRRTESAISVCDSIGS